MDSDVGPSIELLKSGYENTKESTEKDEDIGPSIDLFQSNELSESDKSTNEKNDLKRSNDCIKVIPEFKEPLPYESSKKKLKLQSKVSDLSEGHLSILPKSKYYQMSYMHRTTLTRAQFSKSGFLVTTSLDGVLKIWNKSKTPGMNYVKYYRAHLDSIIDIAMSSHDDYCASIGADKTIKIYDLLNCDMINMIKLTFMPYCCCFVYSKNDAKKYLAVTEEGKGKIYIINVFEKNEIIKILDTLHDVAVHKIIYNSTYETAISFDAEGMIEYWRGETDNFDFPSKPVIKFEYKSDTDLYYLFNNEIIPLTAACSPTGKYFAVYSNDRKIRVYNFRSGKIFRIFDESISSYTDTDKSKEIASMELGRRLAVEKELDQSEFKFNMSIEFDMSGKLLIFPSILGVQIVDIKSQQLCRLLGAQENIRFMGLAVSPVASNYTMNPNLLMYGIEETQTVEDIEQNVPLIICTGFKRNRYYMFTNNEPLASLDSDGNQEIDRDVMNEKPTKEEILASNEANKSRKGAHNRSSNTASGSLSKYHSMKLATQAIVHTSLGDITLELYPQFTPKSVENFATHATNGYYNGRIFHRVIKNFMIQAGCPFGNGTGGVSIWGGEFQDEFHTQLKQDKPYLLCMANTGEKHTNGSQFFITLKPCKWLENKHTIFGKATSGLDIIQKIGDVAIDKNDKPVADITIISISVKVGN